MRNDIFVCPFMSTAQDKQRCYDLCALNVNGQCSVKIIAEKANHSEPAPAADGDE